jgi:hypothetical protein
MYSDIHLLIPQTTGPGAQYSATCRSNQIAREAVNMQLRTASVLTAAVLAALCLGSPDPVEAQTVAGVRVRVHALKKSMSEQKSGTGPILVEPQSAIELEWRVLNATGDTLDIPPPAVFRLRVPGQKREIPVRTEWAPDMTLRARTKGELVVTTAPLGAVALPDGASLWVRGSTKRLDGSAFAPGDYVLELDASDLQQASAGGGRTVPPVDLGFPIHLRIVGLSTPERQRQFHILGGFYERVDSTRALEHYTALASLPGALWSDGCTATSEGIETRARCFDGSSRI